MWTSHKLHLRARSELGRNAGSSIDFDIRSFHLVSFVTFGRVKGVGSVCIKACVVHMGRSVSVPFEVPLARRLKCKQTLSF